MDDDVETIGMQSNTYSGFGNNIKRKGNNKSNFLPAYVCRGVGLGK